MRSKLIALICLMLMFGLLGANIVSAGIVIERRISSGTDDVEERADGSLDITSSDLEMPYENPGRGSLQVIGLRFQDVTVPEGAMVTAAWLQFEADETKDAEPVDLLIEGQLDPNPVTFSDELNNVTNRPTTDANAFWSVPVWPEIGAQGPDQRSTDLTSIIQEIISQDGWASGNALVLIVRDDPDFPSLGVRTAASYSLPSGAPLLHIEIFGTSATEPVPADGAAGVIPTSLAWTPGDTAVSHDVYCGTNPTPGPDEFMGRQVQPLFALTEELTPGTTYYWRIDEVEADGATIHTGAVWSFTVATVMASGPLPLHDIQPCPDPYPSAVDIDHHLGVERNRRGRGIPGIGKFVLTTLGVQFLAEITHAAHQGHRYQRHFKIGGGAHRIAGQHAQAARISGNGVREGDFHGKICDARAMGKFVQHDCLPSAGGRSAYGFRSLTV